MQNSDTITLSQGISWSSGPSLSGIVTSVGVGQLILGKSSTALNSAALTDLTLHLSDDKNLEFSGSLSWSATADAYVFAVDSSGEAALLDLIGQLRKNQHINLCSDHDVEASDRFTGFERFSLLPNAIPELAFADLDTSQQFLGRQFNLPVTITGMTGGVAKGTMINQRLAAAAQHFKIPMGVGSQRIALENPKYAKIFAVKESCPDLFLIGNLGFAQLREENYLELCERAVAMIDADALAIHVNVIQEAVQVEGDRSFSGIYERLTHVCSELKVPVIVKEVGSGMTPDTVTKLVKIGVTAVDVGGKGGTSWGYIEGLRSQSWQTKALAKTFRNWGIPTAFSLTAAHRQQPGAQLIATGGIRDGLMVAKAMALGATMAGVGLPFLRAALESEERLFETVELFGRGLEVAMMSSGCQSLRDLKQRVRLGHPYESDVEDYFNTL